MGWDLTKLSDELRRKIQASVSAGSAGQTSASQRTPINEPLAAREVQEAGTGKVLVRVQSRRKRLADPDGLIPKYFLDMLRYGGQIADDTASHISLEVSQEKVSGKEAEETIIEIYQAEN